MRLSLLASTLTMLFLPGARQGEIPTRPAPKEAPLTPLMEAVKSGNMERVKLLLKSPTDLEAVGPRGDTALVMAAKLEFAPIVKLLISHGADLLHINSAGRGALHYMAAGSWEMLDLLRGAQWLERILTFRDMDGWTPLDLAILLRLRNPRESVDCQRFFREARPFYDITQNRAWIQSASNDGTTALHLAVGANQVDVVAELFAFGADPSARDARGWDARDWARRGRAGHLDLLLNMTNLPEINNSGPGSAPTQSLQFDARAAAPPALAIAAETYRYGRQPVFLLFADGICVFQGLNPTPREMLKIAKLSAAETAGVLRGIVTSGVFRCADGDLPVLGLNEYLVEANLEHHTIHQLFWSDVPAFKYMNSFDGEPLGDDRLDRLDSFIAWKLLERQVDACRTASSTPLKPFLDADTRFRGVDFDPAKIAEAATRRAPPPASAPSEK